MRGWKDGCQAFGIGLMARKSGLQAFLDRREREALEGGPAPMAASSNVA